jgi:lipopolysaccharide export system protein LptA
MRNRVERLRIYLLGSAVFLVLVISAFVVAARYLRHRLLANIPSRLGINVVRETDGYTYCQSVQGRTLYCIHAAKAVERTDGKIALHDVSIALYGRRGDRSDRISGEEFEYDKNQGVVRATGVVHLDLQAAATAGHAEKITHVTTSGLVYLQKLGVAATSAPIEFASAGWTGHATGADYASDSGVLTLHSAVSISGLQGGHVVDLAAASAQFDDRSQQAILTGAAYRSDGRTATARQATLHRRPDGTLSRVEAVGDVSIAEKGATVLAQNADVELTATSQPATAVLTGGVRYAADGPLRQAKAEAAEARITFGSGAKPQPQHAVFNGAVHIAEKTRKSAGESWSTQDVTAATLVTELVPSGNGKVELRDADATGSPRLVLVDQVHNSKGSGPQTTVLSGDDLKAHLIASGTSGQPQLESVAGRGHTLLVQTDVGGIVQSSAGDSLDAKFRAGGRTTKPAAGEMMGGLALQSVVQQGHVTVVLRKPVKAASGSGAKQGDASSETDVQQATAERATYDGEQDRMILTGNPQLVDGQSALWATELTLDHGTRDAHAVGAVKVSYIAPPNGNGTGKGGSQPDGPAHIVADSVDMIHATQTAIFHGRPVRMWQGANQVHAPVIEFGQAAKTITAHSEGAGSSSGAAQLAQVHTTLVLAQPASATASPASSAKPPPCAVSASMAATPGRSANVPVAASPVVQVASGSLIYSETLRRADFSGGVRAETQDGTIRAGSAAVYLRPVADKDAPVGHAEVVDANKTLAGPSLAGGVDHIVATGGVALDRTGMHATGERLAYNAGARTALLTGTVETPPRAVTPQGTTSGAELRFQAACGAGGGGTVEVVGAPGQPVQTELRSAAQEKAEKGRR